MRPLSTLGFFTLGLFAVGLPACGEKASPEPGEGDTGASAEGGVAELAPLSSGACPDMSTSGTTAFLSSDTERTVTVVVPDPLPTEPMPVVFFFHGLMDPGSTPNPTDAMASALGLQSLADQEGVLIILPESGLQSLAGYDFFLWDVQGDGAADLALFDDLRTCAARQHDVDLDRLVAWGFSGGALWTTVVLSQRADTLAAAIEMSGGSDIDAYIYDDLIARYEPPAWTLPVLLQSGGANDVWPDPSFVIIDFTEATDRLEQQLADDGSLVVRCEHSAGHTVTRTGMDLAIAWSRNHRFGEPSPWAEHGLGSDSDWCVLHDPGE